MRIPLVVVVSATLFGGPAFAQTQSGVQAPPQPQVTELEDLVVIGRRLEIAVQQYVESIAAPPRARGLARWNDAICVDVVNAQPVMAIELKTRIVQVAQALDVAVEPDGCDPNLVVMATDDGSALAEGIVDRFRSRFFRFGYSRSNRGSEALAAFQTSDAPVRWWHVSLPVHAVTGEPAIRLPGGEYAKIPCYSRSVSIKDMSIAHLGGSRTGDRCNGITDQIVGLWVVIDLTAATGLTLTQLSDYVAFIAMAQVEAEASTSAFDTVLNVFDSPASVSGITDWDEAYLTALYSGENERLDGEEQAARMVGTLRPVSDPR